MMLEPSIDSLMEQINSKYMLVTISAKRARELQLNHSGESNDAASRKFVGMALREIEQGKLEYKAEDEK
ncbi:MAG TPA: DNA-directed RNA polymerase subunit omega [Bacillales bacterium]|nr:DNA-directed RNA polymerase subunit omega [Bacillales bacterium]